MRYVSCLVLASALLAQPSPQTTGIPEKGMIEGQVFDSISGEPLNKAQVTLQRLGQSSGTRYSAATDSGGHFTMSDLEPGKYRLFAQRNGFVSGAYGARGANRSGATLSLDPGQQLKDLAIRLTPQGVIAGRIVDEDGDPVVRAQVQALRYRHVAGNRQLTPGGSASTNDLGEYRIFGLPPGRYFIRATRGRSVFLTNAGVPVSGVGADAVTDESYVPTYYPGTIDPASAAQVQVAPGNQLRGMDLTLSKTQTMRISGRVIITPTGNIPRSTIVYVVPRDASYGRFFNRTTTGVRDPQGRFELRGVMPGSYILAADSFEENTRLSARLPIEVGSSNVEGLTLTLVPGLEVPGRLRLEGQGTLNVTDIRITLQPRRNLMGGGAGAAVKDDSSFTLRHISPDDYDVRVYGLPANFYLKSVRTGNQDVLKDGLNLTQGAADPLEIVLSSAGGQVDGVVVDDKQQPATGVSVVLLPDPSRRDQTFLYKTANTDQYGRFGLLGIAPGDYKLFAWENVEGDAYHDPEFLKQYENLGQSVTIRENSRETAQLKLIPADDNSDSGGSPAANH